MLEKKGRKMWRTAEELRSPVNSIIEGTVPNWVQGLYLRVGPGKFDFDDWCVNHWFDGYSILSKFEIKNGKVSFTTKFLESEAYKRASVHLRPVVCEFGTKAHFEAGKGLFSRIVSSIIPEMSDNANINLFKLGKEVFVTGETCFFRNLTLDQLSSTEKHDTHKCFGLNVASAHPITDTDGTTYNIGTTVLTGLKYHIVKIPPIPSNASAKDCLKKSKIIATIPSRWNTLFSYNHSFGMTENYIILIEQPFVLNATKLLSFGLYKGQNQCFSDWLEWKPELGNRFHIVEKKTGRILKTEYLSAHPFFFLHYINCYEEDDHIVLDLSIFDSPEVLFSQYLERLRSASKEDDANRAYGVRFVVPLDCSSSDDNSFSDLEDGTNLVRLENTTATGIKSKKSVILTHDRITGKGLELPIINPEFRRKKNRYYYATGLTSETQFKNCICKVDVETKETKIWRGDGYVFGEPVFIPRPGALDEDDGIVMACMTDTRDDTTDCLFFFDAATMAESGRATFQDRIPPSIHGLFLPSTS